MCICQMSALTSPMNPLPRKWAIELFLLPTMKCTVLNYRVIEVLAMGVKKEKPLERKGTVACLVIASINFCPRRWDLFSYSCHPAWVLPQMCCLLTWNHTKPSVWLCALLLPGGTYPTVLDPVNTDAALNHIGLFQAFGQLFKVFICQALPSFLPSLIFFSAEHWVSMWLSVKCLHILADTEPQKPLAFTSPT